MPVWSCGQSLKGLKVFVPGNCAFLHKTLELSAPIALCSWSVMLFGFFMFPLGITAWLAFCALSPIVWKLSSDSPISSVEIVHKMLYFCLKRNKTKTPTPPVSKHCSALLVNYVYFSTLFYFMYIIVLLSCMYVYHMLIWCLRIVIKSYKSIKTGVAVRCQLPYGWRE